jgi:hypothetical protein
LCVVFKKNKRSEVKKWLEIKKLDPPIIQGQQPQGYMQPQYGVPQGYMQQQPMMYQQQQVPVAVAAPVASEVVGDDDFKGLTASLA